MSAHTLISWFVIVLLGMARGARAQAIAITGGTLIDVSNYGHSAHDIEDAVVLIEGGRVTAVGPAGSGPAGSGPAGSGPAGSKHICSKHISHDFLNDPFEPTQNISHTISRPKTFQNISHTIS